MVCFLPFCCVLCAIDRPLGIISSAKMSVLLAELFFCIFHVGLGEHCSECPHVVILVHKTIPHITPNQPAHGNLSITVLKKQM